MRRIKRLHLDRQLAVGALSAVALALLSAGCNGTAVGPGDSVADLRSAGADMKPAGDCSPRPTGNGGIASVVTRCLENGEVSSCDTGNSQPCVAGSVCREWFDRNGNQYYAGCTAIDLIPCDPEETVPRCEGSTEVNCDRSVQDPTLAPPGSLRTSDCAKTVSPTSTCFVEDGSTQCTATACHPESYVATCRADDSYYDCASDSRLYLEHCPAEQFCVVNDLTDGRAVCIVDGATPTSITQNGLVACDGELQVVVAYGYQYLAPCGGTLVCRVGNAGPECVPADAASCNEATFVSVCVGPSLRTACTSSGFTSTTYCGPGTFGGTGMPSIPSACDETTGTCVPTASCNPGIDVEVCDPSHRYRLRCTEFAEQVAEICNGCVEDEGAGTVTCE